MPTLPQVDDSRGAPHGRPNRHAPIESPRFSLQRVRINRGGYDSGGAYWGLGAPLFRATTDDSAVDLFFRAFDRNAAKAFLRAEYPAARFYR